MAPKKPKKSEQSPTATTKKTQKIEASAPVEPSNRERGLAVVGIGASAGGLDALASFFSALRADTGMAFVVVTHLHPEHESHMAELLQRHTSMPTEQVTTRTPVEPNHVYVIPPGRGILMTDTHLDTRPFEEPHGRRTPIDHFFRSMAASGLSDPIAVILSGGGTDGSVGIKDVKEVGGLIMVQQPDEAEYDSMPRAALTTGLVDVVLPAAQLAEKLADYIRHRPKLPHDPGQLSDAEVETLQRILAQVHARTGHDFTQYKRSTILRRVERRMQLNGFTTLEAYLAFLRGNVGEVQSMFNDILIGVTNFFRDRVSWDALQEKVIPQLFKQPGEEIRVWSIGCATGEEAFGIAMLLLEEADRQDTPTQIQVFASDLDERSIAYARDGLYPAAIEADVNAERLERFFTREGDYYRVKREVRDVVLFTNHNVLRDPPFSRQSLIACRNVLIYLQRAVQERVFDTFYYSLAPGGYLFLGTSETAEHLPDLFEVVDKSHRIYQARPWLGERPHIPALPLALRRGPRVAEAYTTPRPPPQRFPDESSSLEDQHRRALESFGPPSVIVNERYAILNVSESAGRYLQQPKGPITNDLLSLIRPELQLEVRAALFHTFEKARSTVSHAVPVQFNGHRRNVVVAVRPLSEDSNFEKASDRRALVFFLEDEYVNPDEVGSASVPSTQTVERDEMVIQLQSEVQHLREQLQVTIEEYDSSNEEMKAANEELQSINEEYRSATEELETSKEELQSLNEELQTVNNEMRGRLEEISRAHGELENLMGATEIPTLFLDREMRIQRFSAGVQDLFSMLQVDRGRRIKDLTHKLGYIQFVDDAEEALRQLTPVEREVQTPEGNWYLIRIRPYRTVENKIEGVVITFIDIRKLKATEQELVRAKETLEERVLQRTHQLDDANRQARQARDLFSGLFDANPIPTAMTRMQDDVFLNVNAAFLAYFALESVDLVGRSTDDFNLGLGFGIQWRKDLISRLKSEGRIQNYETEIDHPAGEKKNILASMRSISVENVDCIITTFIDITERVRAEQQIRMLAADLTVAEQEERRRISQVLHDDLQQRLFAVKMQTSMVRQAYQNGDLQSARVDFEQLEELLDKSITMARNLSIDLSPAVLQGEGLADALVWVAAQMYDQYGLRVSIHTNGISTRFDDTLRILLFQAVREALFNVVKHAQTDRATIFVARSGKEIQIKVGDHGQGFVVDETFTAAKSTGGLMNIRHRLNLMGCDLHIESQPKKGTKVVIHVPADQVHT